MKRDKIILITGANSGIGRATALELAKPGATVIMVCRDKERGEEALQEVRRISNYQQVHLMLCDLSSIEEITQFCKDFKKRFNKLDVLINNAGVILLKRQLTRDGFEFQLGVNHLGHFLLTNLLMDVILESQPARIINVSSGAHKEGRIHFEDMNLSKGYSVFCAYAQSKLANILFTYELSRRLQGTDVCVNCLHPGAVATQMGIDRKTGSGTFITRCLKPFFQDPLKGAETSIYLATSAHVEGMTGRYFYREKAVPSSKRSYNLEDAKRLWDISMEMTGLSEE